MKAPVVSVIIPAYNPGSYLSAALDSVLAQTMKDWELIVVDDGSPENVADITRRYTCVKLLRQNNAGQSVARNLGIEHAAGEFIAFLDQDDVWMPTKLERQLDLMQNDPGLGLCHTQFTIADESMKKVMDGFGRQQSYLEMLQGSGICGASTVMMRKSVAVSCGMFDSAFDPAEDYDLWLRVASQFRTAFVPSVEVLYRQHSQNQSLGYDKTYRTIRAILSKHAAQAKDAKRPEAIRAVRKGLQRIRPTYGAQAFDSARRSLRAKDFRLFLKHLGFALRNAPQYTAKCMLSHLAGR